MIRMRCSSWLSFTFCCVVRTLFSSISCKILASVALSGQDAYQWLGTSSLAVLGSRAEGRCRSIPFHCECQNHVLGLEISHIHIETNGLSVCICNIMRGRS